jgi:hypothetical protein
MDVDEICRKLRETAREYGQEALKGAIVLCPYGTNGGQVGGHKCIDVPTLDTERLAYVSWEVARFFEEA